MLTGLAPLGPLKSTIPPPKKISKKSKKTQKVPQKVPQKDPSLSPRPYGESLSFWVFPKLYLPWGGQPKKSISRLPTWTRGRPMPNLVEIHPVVWAPNPNKQTDRHLSFIPERREKESFWDLSQNSAYEDRSRHLAGETTVCTGGTTYRSEVIPKSFLFLTFDVLKVNKVYCTANFTSYKAIK